MREHHRNARFAGVLAIVASGFLAVCAHAITIVDYAVPTAAGIPGPIVSGADGNLWFAEGGSGKLARITTAGAITEFNVVAGAITAGPDGAVWFTEGAAVGRISPSGQVTLFPYAGTTPNGIAAGADGNLYFTESGGKIGRITPQGAITEFPLAITGEAPEGIAPGPDGALWYTAIGCRTCDTTTPDVIGRITTAGAVAEFPIPTVLADPFAIVAGADGNLWFTEAGCDYCSPRFPGSKIGRITPGGVITEFNTPTPASAPTGIARGPDGNVWFTENAVNQVASITPGGAIAEYPIPVGNSKPQGIATGVDGNVWFTESNADRIGKIILAPTGAQVATTPVLSSAAFLAMLAVLIAGAYFARRLPR